MNRNMNRCANCGRKIEKDTVWCPFCGTEQNPKYSIYGTLLLFILLAALVMFGCYKYKEKEQKKKDIEKYGNNYKYQSNSNSNSNDEEIDYDVWYKIEKETFSDYSYEAEGYVLNKEEEPIRNVKILFTCYSSDNGQLVVSQISDSKSIMKKNELWKFKVKYSGKVDRCEFETILLTK